MRRETEQKQVQKLRFKDIYIFLILCWVVMTIMFYWQKGVSKIPFVTRSFSNVKLVTIPWYDQNNPPEPDERCVYLNRKQNWESVGVRWNIWIISKNRKTKLSILKLLSAASCLWKIDIISIQLNYLFYKSEA